MKYAEEKTLEKMLGAAEPLVDNIMAAQESLNTAVLIYDTIPLFGYGNEPSDGIEAAAEETAKFLTTVQEFDRQLAELIMLRGRLAEETGIPMFSHINAGKTWTRFDTYGM